MKLAIPLEDNNELDSTISSIFGRAPFFMIIDPDSYEFTVEENPATKAPGGAGIQAAQWMIDQDVAAVISGNLGPKAHEVLAVGKIAVYKFTGGSIADVVNAYIQQTLESFFEPNVNAHSGMR